MKAYLYSEPTYYDAIEALARTVGNKPKDIDKKTLVFAPEKATLTIERKIAELKGGFMNVRVFSFGKFLKYFGDGDKILSKEASVMLISKILSEADNLKRFKSFGGSFAVNLYDSISLLKSAKVSPEEIRDLSVNDGILNDKLSDLYSIYSSYENYLSNKGYKDENGMLSKIPSLIKDYRDIKNTDVYLVGYNGWTASARDIVTALLENAASVTVISVDGENKGVYTSEISDAFIKICSKTGVSLSVGEGLLKSSCGVAVQNEKEIILDRTYSEKAFKAPRFETDKVILKVKKNEKEELREIAETIRTGVINGMRYKDFCVALPCPDDAYQEIEEIFADYDVPYYADVKKKFSSHPLARLVLSYLDLIRKNCSRDAVLATVKNPLFEEDASLTDKFENYLLKYDINYSGFLSALPRFEDVPDLENLRKRVAAVYVKEKTATAGEFVSLIKDFLKTVNVEDKITELSAALSDYPEEAEYAKGALKILNETLDYVVELIPDVKISVKEFGAFLANGFASSEVSIIPQRNDAVYVGEYTDVGNARAKVLFFPCLNDGVPAVKQDIAVLSDRELSVLDDLKVIIEPKVKSVNARQREIFCSALTAFSDKLYLSYSVEDASGKPQAKSDVMKYLVRSFGLKAEKEDILKDDSEKIAERYLAPKQAEKRFALETGRFRDGFSNDLTGAASYYFTVDEGEDGGLKKRTQDVLEGLNSEIGRVIEGGIDFSSDTVTVTGIESFYSCPFKWFMERCVGISEREEGKLKPRDSGNIIHLASELYVNAFKNGEITDEESSDIAVEKIVEAIFSSEDVKRLSSAPCSENEMERLKEEVRRTAKAIYRQLTAGSFAPLGTEVEFGKKGSAYPPIILKTAKKDYKICGKVDRIDKYKNYYRIIDYKTGSDKIADQELFMGKKLQLYLYLKAFESEGVAAGAYYASIKDAFSKEDGTVTYLSGNTLAEDEVVTATDSSYFTANQSDVIGLKYSAKKNGERKISSNGFSAEDIAARKEYAKTVAEKGVEYMSGGFIAPTPYAEGLKSTCDYCPFGAVCGFESGVSGKKRTAIKASPVEALSNELLAAGGEKRDKLAAMVKKENKLKQDDVSLSFDDTGITDNDGEEE